MDVIQAEECAVVVQQKVKLVGVEVTNIVIIVDMILLVLLAMVRFIPSNDCLIFRLVLFII